MTTLKRSAAIRLMEALGFSSAHALSTSRLEKKLNRINKVTLPDKLEDPELNDRFTFVMKAIEEGLRVKIEDDRPEIPNDEKPATRAGKSNSKSGSSSKRGFGANKKESKYDWTRILSGSIVELQQGQDYTCKSAAFAMQVRSAARRKGLKVRVAVQKGRVIVQAEGPAKG